MADSKLNYSNNSITYTTKTIYESESAMKKYNHGKYIESIFNNDWKKTPVNINEIVDKFAPKRDEYVLGYKYIYDGENYRVVADMIGGYLRIVDKKTNQPLKLNGKPGSKKETHFKIKKRSEM